MLYIVGTPIGNLSDISERVIDTLKKVDYVLCEDTRVTSKLCNKFNIETSLISYHHHSGDKKTADIIKKLEKGLDIALVTDSGTPGIADPAGKLIKKVTDLNITEVSPIPGPSAVSTAASIAGFYMNRFTFLGFPPKKRKRKKFFEEVLSYDHPVIFYESPYRILKTLEEICEINPGNQTVVCRELTKMYENIYRGTTKEILEELKSEKHTKGEFTVIIKN
jgi:16S rRNA (cytidine1402-2'-O)-methyltransferase